MIRRIVLAFMCVVMGLASNAFADCASPAGRAGDMGYADNFGTMVFCNGSDWVSMAGGVSVTVGGTTGATTMDELTDATITTPATGQYLTYSGGGQWVNTASPLGTITDTKWCVGNSSGQVVCNTDAPITVESDPQVGTLTNTKWCTTDGTAINCGTDAPVTTEVDPQLDTLTANLFCQVNAGGTALVCANTAATQRTALELGTMAIQNANAVAISGGSITGLTSLSVAGIVTASFFEGDGSRLTGIAAGADNMGDHTATRDVLMGAYNISSTGYVSATAFYSGDGAAYFYNNFVIPSLVFDTDDYLRYTRATNMLDVMIGGTSYARVTSGGISTTTLTADVVTASTVNGQYASFTTLYAGSASATTANVGSLTASGIVTASFFEGDGSRLTGIATSSAEGDRITSGTLLVTANEAGNYVSLTNTTTSATWGYFGSGASYLPQLTSVQLSASTVSSTVVQMGGRVFGTVLGSGGNAIASGTTNVTTYSNNLIRMSTDGSERMTVDATGQVGIATTAPNATLDVAGTISTSSLTVNGVAITANGGSATAASSTGAIQFNVANAFAGDGANLFWDDANNRLGVGTASPILSAGVGLEIKGASGSVGALRIGTPLNSWEFISPGNSGNGNLGLYDVGNAAYRMYIVSGTGNVGIGTTSPYSKLGLVGSIGAYSSGVTSGGSPIGASLYLGDSNFNSSSYYNAAPGISAVYDATPSVAAGLAFYTYANVANSRTERMRIDFNGNVGIGDVPNTYRLYTLASDYNAARIGLITTGRSGTDYPALGYNVKFKSSAGTYDYFGTDLASMIKFGSGKVETFTAASGSAGSAITFTTGPYVANLGTTWTAGSDVRLKKNIETYPVLERLKDYRAVTFDWRQTGKHDVGVIAQEIYKVFPEVVDKGTSGTTPISSEDPGKWGVQYDKLGALALQAIKELKAQNDALAKRVEQLEAERNNQR